MKRSLLADLRRDIRMDGLENHNRFMERFPTFVRWSERAASPWSRLAVRLAPLRSALVALTCILLGAGPIAFGVVFSRLIEDETRTPEDWLPSFTVATWIWMSAGMLSFVLANTVVVFHPSRGWAGEAALQSLKGRKLLFARAARLHLTTMNWFFIVWLGLAAFLLAVSDVPGFG